MSDLPAHRRVRSGGRPSTALQRGGDGNVGQSFVPKVTFPTGNLSQVPRSSRARRVWEQWGLDCMLLSFSHQAWAQRTEQGTACVAQTRCYRRRSKEETGQKANTPHAPRSEKEERVRKTESEIKEQQHSGERQHVSHSSPLQTHSVNVLDQRRGLLFSSEHCSSVPPHAGHDEVTLDREQEHHADTYAIG
ncbi:hypothetical protein QQF64_027168 [Cirrhinus molitorella]|uniref:Uncharacterized protein n=1 Tax=Cirrhinus molitorella TaxID=172907 RepID=A0ABR3NBN8_9TELE